ncbi:MAG TPA: MotA/TolQ/ExbB proton channel family protein [Blastocatellia bacterium]|nr:MotA/TolQ/ExbB proton channel family protein [Blastocatellia bacterium]
MTGTVGFTLALIQSSVSDQSTFGGLLLKASPLAKAVLALLAVFSVASWAIIISKWLWLRRAESATRDFLDRFLKRKKLSDVFLDSETLKESPVARVFLSGYDEISKQIGGGTREIYSLDAISRVLQSRTIEEVTAMEKKMSWLATTANASPFIGLFGTVVGIIIAFQGLSAASGSSIQAVAPGIADALIATAAGIAAAVPAAIFYNHFLSRIKALTAAMDRFSLEILNVVERHYVRANV